LNPNFLLYIGIGIQRGWRTDRKLHVDTLIYLEEPIKLPSPHQINFSLCLFVCPLVMKTPRSGCPRGVFCLSSIPSKYLFLCTRRKFWFKKKICRNLLIQPARYLGKYTAHNDYTEEEVRRISIATAILVSATVLELGGVLASGRVTHVVA
jgi:hypothetical protein